MSAQADEDDAYRESLNARVRVELETAMRLVKASHLSPAEQAEMVAGMASYCFGAAAAARKEAHPGETPQQLAEAMGSLTSALTLRVKQRMQH